MSNSDHDRPPSSEDESSVAQLDDDEVRNLLKKALLVDRTPPAEVLTGVQKKLRERSKGKFFADGWSTTNSPKSTYFVTSIVMLVIIVVLYFALTPGGWGTP